METQAFGVGLEVWVGVPKMETRGREIQVRRLSRLHLRGSRKPGAAFREHGPMGSLEGSVLGICNFFLVIIKY